MSKKSRKVSGSVFSKKYALLLPLVILVLGVIGFFVWLNVFKDSFPSIRKALALGVTYYVATDGSDTNAGNSAAPFKTFAKGVSVLEAGDTLLIKAGTYTQKLNINRGGTIENPVNISAVPGDKVVIDLNKASGPNIYVGASNVIVSDIEAVNSSNHCVDLGGTYITAKNLIAHECVAAGIYTTGQHITIDGNTVYRSVLENVNKNTGFISGIKVKVGGEDITIKNNRVYNNFGEGFGITRGVGVKVLNNVAYDNYSVNIYIDNSKDVLVDGNFSYCTTDQTYWRNGHAPHAIAIGEEFYDGWGAQLANVTIQNNVASHCYKGISRFSSDVPGGGMDNVLIANNTFWGSDATAMSIEYDATKTRNSLITNNIVHGKATLVWIENRTGIEMSNNFWVGSMPSSSSGGVGTNDKSGDVKMLTAPVRDNRETFRLSADSPAIGAGRQVASVINDFEGKVRSTLESPLVDIGAIEYAAASGTPATSTPTVAPTAIPTATPVTATSTPVATSTPTVAPTATPVGNTAPAFQTTSMPNGNRGVAYSANVVTYDYNLNDTLTMTATSMTTGLTLGNCVQTTNTTQKRVELTCKVTGTPTSRSSNLVAFTVKDDKGGSKTRSMRIRIR